MPKSDIEFSMLKLYNNFEEFCEKNHLTPQEGIVYLEGKLVELQEPTNKSKIQGVRQDGKQF